MGESPSGRSRFERGYVLAFAIGAAIIAVLPNLYGLVAAPPGSAYQGFQWAADDHYVYAAWMRQAMDGRVLMDNRFTTDAQPGLTINIYFFVLGLLAKLIGIPAAMAIAKMAFAAAFVFLAHKLISNATDNVYTTKLALALAVLGQGIGFLVWETFGPEFERGGPFQAALQAIGLPGVPIDVWQPEAYAFSSILTNGLFSASLCLILGIFLCFLQAKHSWRPVLPGAVLTAILMNMHSYDVLLIAQVMVAFLAMQIARRDVDFPWVGRSLVIGLGAVPPALWFMHVLASDRVFQERASTPTYSPNFKVFALGIVAMALLAAMALFRAEFRRDRKRTVGIGIVAMLGATLFFTSSGTGGDGFFLSPLAWGATFVVAATGCALMAGANAASNLVLAWGVVGIVAPYFPALFQRKLAMGVSVPWAILAAVGLSAVILDRERSKRNLATALSILILGGTSLRWFFREIELIRLNVSNTTVHSVYHTRDVQAIIAYLNALGTAERRVVVAMPGAAHKDEEAVDSFFQPIVPDLNPVVSGLTGVYTYAGHWSETPNYLARRNESALIFLAQTSEAERQGLLSKIGVDFLLAPDPDAFPGIADLSYLGKTVAGGNQFRLIQIGRS